MRGFCTSCADDVPINLDGRCIDHGSRTLPPSTGCNHQRWQPTEGAWSPCAPIEGEIRRRVCKPVAPGTWRTTLDGGKRPALTPAEHERQEAARRFGGITNAVPTLTTAHKPQQWHLRHVSCSDCHGTTRPFYRSGRCRPCFDVWETAQQYRRKATA
jgi:hypothetical protein